jgi:hypothetical protein
VDRRRHNMRNRERSSKLSSFMLVLPANKSGLRGKRSEPVKVPEDVARRRAEGVIEWD